MSKTLESIRHTGEVDASRHEEECLFFPSNWCPHIGFHREEKGKICFVSWEDDRIIFPKQKIQFWFYLKDLEPTE